MVDTTAGVHPFHQRAIEEAPGNSWRCGDVFLPALLPPSSKNQGIFILKMTDGWSSSMFDLLPWSIPPPEFILSTKELLRKHRGTAGDVATCSCPHCCRRHRKIKESQYDGRLR
jgi:hypothetical protein